ncbi:S-adenosyl-L-methionine-dependent methyltransferase [Rhodocollybia butyracea]|uniref:S-adenosyl-L-methionine-dependent methyltransferase n=1 Tax=Rhodocollybia butyracea TaxID=206335 RepID=A0A9P5Q686_9AGAR|nr:S-adenosyl-L-methionine-dependent methyltransferase [Rhodocollybia butyracea]
MSSSSTSSNNHDAQHGQESAEDQRTFAADDDPNAGMVELSDDEFSAYFTVRAGRRYQSETAASPYPLPVDTPENQRVTALHKALRGLIGANYIGPVSQVLSPQQGQRKVCIDLGCGRGEWVMEMAREFPHVTFHGLDIVPIAPRYPEDNAHFELHDIGERTRWANASVDMIHARSIFMTVRDYSVIIQESARILKPGGLFLSGESGQFPAFYGTLPEARDNPGLHVPGLDRFYRLLHSALEHRGISWSVASSVRECLQVSSGAFTDIIEHIFYLPIGTWNIEPSSQRLGRSNRVAMTRFMDSVRPLLLASGLTGQELDDLYSQCYTEMYGVPGLVSIYYLVEARRT